MRFLSKGIFRPLIVFVDYGDDYKTSSNADNIQLWPSWKVNIHHYQIEKELFLKARWADQKELFRHLIIMDINL